MSGKYSVLLALSVALDSISLGVIMSALRSQPPTSNGSPDNSLEHRFSSKVQPFLERYCISCHGPKKRKGRLDLSRDLAVADIAKNAAKWERVLERLHAQEMPPDDAPKMPTADERAGVIAWIRELCDLQAERTAGDPGTVLARRLSNAEFDYTIRDLTGVDIRPAGAFPVVPANEAGFDNSGESLAMSPALFKKSRGAARLVADHVVLKPEGFVFGPHPVVADTDRDKYCVQRIIDFYKRHQVDTADYFLAAFAYRHRVKLRRPDANLTDFATEAKPSARYLALVWSAMNDGDAEAGPLAAVRKRWQDLPAPAGPNGGLGKPDLRRPGDLVVRIRTQLRAQVKKRSVTRISPPNHPPLFSQPTHHPS